MAAVLQRDWKRVTGRPYTPWLATMKNDLSYHNLSVEGGSGPTTLGMLTANRAMHWTGASRTESGKFLVICIVLQSQ